MTPGTQRQRWRKVQETDGWRRYWKAVTVSVYRKLGSSETSLNLDKGERLCVQEQQAKND